MKKERFRRTVALLLEGLCHEVANTVGAILAFLELSLSLIPEADSSQISALYSRSQKLVEKLKELRRLLDEGEKERLLRELFKEDELEAEAGLLSSRVRVCEAPLKFALRRLRELSGGKNRIKLLAESNGFVLAEIKLPSQNLFKDKTTKLENYDLFFTLQLLGAEFAQQGEEAPCRVRLKLEKAD